MPEREAAFLMLVMLAWGVYRGRVTPEALQAPTFETLRISPSGGLTFTVVSQWLGDGAELPITITWNQASVLEGRIIPDRTGIQCFHQIVIQKVGVWPEDQNGARIGVQVDGREMASVVVELELPPTE